MGSPFSFEKIPDGFQGFVKEKQLEILNNVVTSAVFGVVLANGVSLVEGDASVQVLTETTKAVLPIFALGVVTSGVVKIFKKE